MCANFVISDLIFHQYIFRSLTGTGLVNTFHATYCSDNIHLKENFRSEHSSFLIYFAYLLYYNKTVK